MWEGPLSPDWSPHKGASHLPNKKPGDWRRMPLRLPVLLSNKSSGSGMVLARFCATHDQLAAEEFLVVQFLHGAFCFINREHLHEGEALRTLVVFIGHDLGVLDRADP